MIMALTGTDQFASSNSTSIEVELRKSDFELNLQFNWCAAARPTVTATCDGVRPAGGINIENFTKFMLKLLALNSPYA